MNFENYLNDTKLSKIFELEKRDAMSFDIINICCWIDFISIFLGKLSEINEI